MNHNTRIGYDGRGVFAVSGVAVYVDSGQTEYADSDGNTVAAGVVVIVQLSVRTAGNQYAVTIDGEILIIDGVVGMFRTLADAATFAEV